MTSAAGLQAPGTRTSGAALVAHQARYEMRAYWRNTRARIFTVMVPVALLVILVLLFGSNGTATAGGHKLKIGAYYAPHIAAMAIVGAAMVNLLISMVTKRESGSLKRRRATPVPSWVLIAADMTTSIVSGVLIVAILVAIGTAFGLPVNAPAIGIALVVTVVGTASFCCVAYALSTVVGSADSAGPMTQLATLPVYFISGIYIPDNVLPHWVLDVAEILPVRPLAVALQAAFVPATNGGVRFAAVQVLIVVAWGVAGLLVAVRRFSWAPRRS
jgi:ABC-2 type transport system permease protein